MKAQNRFRRTPLLLSGIVGLLFLTTAGPAQEHRTQEHRTRTEDRHVFVFESDDGTVIKERIQRGSRAFLGVQLIDLTDELRELFGVPAGEGVLVSRVEAESPAASVGFRAGDILTRLGEETVAVDWDVRRVVSRRTPGDSLSIEFWRDGSIDRIEVALGSTERNRIDIASILERRRPGRSSAERTIRRTVPIELEDGHGVWMERDEAGGVMRIEIDRNAVDSAADQLHELLQKDDREQLTERIRRLEERLERLARQLAERDGK